MKHILLVSQYFYPETFRVNDMAATWVQRGYKVTVLTGIPNYPLGKFYAGYDYRHKRRELWKGVDIIRIPLIARGNSRNKILNAAGMAANYLSFIVSGKRWVKKNDINADLVYCRSKPHDSGFDWNLVREKISYSGFFICPGPLAGKC